MTDEPGRPCPFVTAEGCSVYPDRPAACRTYPIGRATRLDGSGALVEQYFLVKEPHCQGFRVGQDWTFETWTADQGLEDYNRSNDRLMGLMARAKAIGQPIDHRRATMVLLALFQVDRFGDFLRDMQVFDRVELEHDAQERVFADEEARLDFAFDWAELMLFGDCPRLGKKA